MGDTLRQRYERATNAYWQTTHLGEVDTDIQKAVDAADAAVDMAAARTVLYQVLGEEEQLSMQGEHGTPGEARRREEAHARRIVDAALGRDEQ